MTDLEYAVHRYAACETTYEQFFAYLHWFCPWSYYPYPHYKDAVERWHAQRGGDPSMD